MLSELVNLYKRLWGQSKEHVKTDEQFIKDKERMYKFNDIDYSIEDKKLFVAVSIARLLIDYDIVEGDRANYKASVVVGIETQAVAHHVGKIGAAIMKERNEKYLDKWVDFVKAVEALDDSLLSKVFNKGQFDKYMKTDHVVLISYPSSLSFFMDWIKESEEKWLPIFEKTFDDDTLKLFSRVKE